MARDPRYETLYKVFQLFKERCLLSDHSLLWPDKTIWTIEYLDELMRRFLEEPVVGKELSFEQKFDQQLRGAPTELWGVVADLYYVYCLPSSYIKFDTKFRYVQESAQKAGYQVPPRDDSIWEPQKHGFTRTSLRYHQKYAQFWVIIYLALAIKRSEHPETILENPDRLQGTIDEILEEIPNPIDRAHDMRHALLYLAFPDHYERSISTHHKELILQAYRDRITGDQSEDLDQAVHQVREAMESQYDVKGDGVFDFYDDVKTEWLPEKESGGVPTPPSPKPPIPKPREKDPDLARVQEVFKHTQNVILYGPPGTGKTYIAQKVVEAMVDPQLHQAPSEAINLQHAIDGLPFHDVLALSMYLEGSQKPFSVPEIEKQKIVQARFAISQVKNPKNSIWSYLQAHTDPDSKTVKTTRRFAPYLFEKDQASCWMLTEVGREYVTDNLSESLEMLQDKQGKQTKLEDYIEWVTFHQSFAYEDFVEGLRPVISEEDPSAIAYEIVPGAFRRICTRATNDPKNQYFLVIDEINRGNIAKILGELITLLEDDKRDTMSVRLPYSGDLFTIPTNLSVIGTMNTADRSIALLDVALRRRFAFVEIMPQPDLLVGLTIESEGASVQLDEVLRKLNEEIARHIDRDHQIGHSYFMQISNEIPENRLERLDFVWNHQILPLLEEYFYSQRDKLAEILADFTTLVEIEAEGQEAQNLPVGHLFGPDLVYALSKWVGSG